MIQNTDVLIAGCGYLGRSIGAELLARDARVWALCRSDASLEEAGAAGLRPLKADLTDPSTLRELPLFDAVVACQAPARGESYTAAYLESTRNLLAALRFDAIQTPAASASAASAGRFPRFTLVSSTSVYGPRNGGWVEADTPIDPARLDDDARILFETERLVLSAGGMVLRLSGIYGPGRSRIDSLRSGRFRPVPSEAYTNRIHRDDAAAAAVLLLAKGSLGEVYLATDDRPATQNEFYEWLCARLKIDFSVPAEKPAAGGAPDSHAAQRASDSKRCFNGKLKKLGWTPRFPGYQEGYGALLT